MNSVADVDDEGHEPECEKSCEDAEHREAETSGDGSGRSEVTDRETAGDCHCVYGEEQVEDLVDPTALRSVFESVRDRTSVFGRLAFCRVPVKSDLAVAVEVVGATSHRKEGIVET